MIRHVVAAAGVLAMMSSLAMAETTTVVRTTQDYAAPAYTAPHKTVVVKKRVDRYGRLVTVRKSHRDGFYGSSVSRTRTVTNPLTGVTRSRTVTERE